MQTKAQREAAEDLVYVNRFKAGDEKAFEFLYRRYHRRVFKVARDILSDPVLTADAVQESFMQVHKSLHQFEGRSTFFSWLYMVVKFKAINAYRSRRAYRRRMAKLREQWDGVEPEDLRSDPYRDYAAKEGLSRIQNAISHLPAPQQELLQLKASGLTYLEIADALGIAHGTAMSRLHYARKRLQVALMMENRCPAA